MGAPVKPPTYGSASASGPAATAPGATGANPYTPPAGTKNDANGYAIADQTNFGSNPWDTQLSGDMNAQASLNQNAQMNATNLTNQATAMGASTAPGMTTSNGSNYPAMSNSYGLGSSINSPTMPVGNSGNNYAQNPINISMPDSSSRGFNPWSLTGESNARGGS